MYSSRSACRSNGATLALAGVLIIGLLGLAQTVNAGEKAADLAKYCRTKFSREAFPTVDRRDDGLMCTVRTNRGLALLHRKINAADVCAAQHRTRRFRREGKGLVCITGPVGASTTARTVDLNKHCRAKYGQTAFVTRRRTDGRPMCTIRTDGGLGLRHHLIDLGSLCGGGSPKVEGDKLRCMGSTARRGPGDPSSRSMPNRGPNPTPRRKGGGRLTKADFRGCSVDKKIALRRLSPKTHPYFRRPYSGFIFGMVPTPCPGLAGGRVVDLVEFCRRYSNRPTGLVYYGGEAPACFGPPGAVSVRPYPAKSDVRGLGVSWGRPMVLPAACYWAGGITVKNQRNFVVVFKYAKRRLECFYFKSARLRAIWKRATGEEPKPEKPENAPTITKEY